MGFRNPVYSLRLQPCCFTYETGGISKSGLKLCEFFVESKNFHLEPDRIFFHMTCSLPTNYLSVFGHFVGLTFKGLT